MGVVYQAVDVRLCRAVALKVLPDQLSQDRHALERRTVAHKVGSELYFALHHTESIYPGTFDSSLLMAYRPADTRYLDEYGRVDGAVGTWSADLRHRLFDLERRSEVTARSRLPTA